MFKKLRKLILSVGDLLERMSPLAIRERERLTAALSRNQEKINLELKLKIYNLLKDLRDIRREPFGMTVVAGWEQEWNENYASVLDNSQDIFSQSKFDLLTSSIEAALEVFKKIADFDGAVLVDKNGQIVASGIYLDNVAPKKVASILHPQKAEDLSAAFGFIKKVHTRHLSAIAASYILENTTVFVASEEDGSLRILENGKIIWSTVEGEAS